MRKNLIASCVAAGLFSLTPVLGTADDTDIYFRPSVSQAAEPLVMLSLDYRSNLASVICSDVTSASCTQAAYFRAAGVTAPALPASGPFYFYNEIQAALQVVLRKVDNLKIGLMMSHDNATGCVGQSSTDPNLPSGTKSKGVAACSNGGNIMLGFTDLHQYNNGVELPTSGYSQLFAKLAGIPLPQGTVSHSYQGKELFFEFFRYLTGQGVYNAHLGWTDYGTDNSYDTNNTKDGGNGNKTVYTPTNPPVATWDPTIETSDHRTYVSPLKNLDKCARIFTINFMFGASNQENDSDAALYTTKANGGIPIPADTSNNAFPNVIKYLYQNDLADGSFGQAPNIDGTQNVTSYFVVDDRFGAPNQPSGAYAAAGGTVNPYVVTNDPSQLVAALTDIFNQILSVSTTFTAASIPVNVFNRSQIQNDVYLGLFQADQLGRQAWDGNLKKLKFDSTNTMLVDANNNSAIANDGRIRTTALTFWTDPAAITSIDPNAAAGTTTIGTDGRSVNRGAGGQRVPGFTGTSGVGLVNPGTVGATSARTLFYDDSTDTGRTGALRALNADSTTAKALGTSYLPPFDFGTNISCTDNTSNNGTSIISTLTQLRFLRGMDAVDNSDPNAETGVSKKGNGLCNETRGWVMGDPLHSRPLPINYGAAGGYSKTNPAIYVAIGTNDGYLHFLQNTTTGGTQDGHEVWSYMPKELMGGAGGLQQKLMKNQALSPATHPYGADGSPVSYTYDKNGDGTISTGDGDKAYLYFGLRRGGNGFYGLDISTPLSPAFLWKVNNAQSDFNELGLSFSRPQIGKVRVNGTDHIALFVGGGYSTNKDYYNHSSSWINSADTNSTTGNKGCGCGIFVFDATTGDLLWKAVNGTSTGNSSAKVFTHSALVDSIPADVTIADTDGDGYIDRIIAGDTGGNVWRADLGAFVTVSGVTNPVIDDTTKWKLTKLATLGYHYSLTKADDRRFFNQVDLVRSTDATGPFDAVLIGSGNREDPLDKYGAATNYFYLIKDRQIGVGAPSSDSTLDPTGLGDVTSDCLQLNNCSGSAPNLANGWRLQLQQPGEKNLARSITIGGSVYFTTYIPPSSSDTTQACGPNEGSGRQYAVALQNAFSVVNYYTGDDQTGTSGVASTARDRYDILASGGIPAQDVFIPGGMLLRPDLKTEKPKFSSRITTFWQRLEK